ncbi:MAG: GNAT family N-acetyltransferase [Defluviitaleaceae bacterium]|nr:GNAT family N-acetyltransferase [Defluviitaleaceae bacterium]
MDTIFKIEAGKMSDITELEKLYDDLNDYLEANINYAGWKKGYYPTRVVAEKGIKAGNLFVLKIEDRIVGSVILNHVQETAYAQATWGIEAQGSQVMVIHTLVTHPDFMNQGVSQKLLAFSKTHGLALGCKAIRLDVTIQNKPAIALYEKCGYSYIETVDLGLPYAHLKWFHLYEYIL